MTGVQTCALPIWVGLQPEPGDHAGKARAGPARRPEQVAVLPGVRADQPAVGRHDVQAHHALAGPPARPAVPALPALQQEAAEADRRAVAAGERPAPFGQERRELQAALNPGWEVTEPSRQRVTPDPSHAGENLVEQLSTGEWVEHAPYFEAVAVTGDGVFETLRAVSKLVLKSLA